MVKVVDQTQGQGRWNNLGREQLAAIRDAPECFQIQALFMPSERLVHEALVARLGPIKGLRVLELGCGWGAFTVYLAKQGAVVTGLDIGEELVAAGRLLAEVNHVECEFVQGDARSLQFASGAFDIVVAVATFHHLSKPDLSASLREAHRVLRPQGVAVAYEPVENSRTFSLLQNLFPKGREGDFEYRPSILQRTAYRRYLTALDDRDLTFRELRGAGSAFRQIELHPDGLFIRLAAILPGGCRSTLRSVDTMLLKNLPPLGYLSQAVLVEYLK